MSSPASRAQIGFPTIPKGEVIGRYENYLDAQKVVDYLADNDFPVSNVSIIGNDVKVVERVSGKLSYPKVAGSGAAQGASLGVFFGLLLVLFSPNGQPSLVPLFAAVLLGAVLFMLLSVLRYAMQRGARDFASTKEFLPATWDVVVAHAVANQAKALAAQLPMHPRQAGQGSAWGQAPAQPTPAAPPTQAQATAAPEHAPSSSAYGDLEDGRPRYGVRINQDSAPATDAEVAPAAPASEAAAAGEAAQAAPATDTEETNAEADKPEGQR